MTHASIISRRVQTPRNGNTRIAPAQPSSTATQPPSPQRPPPCAFRPSNNPKRGVTRYQDQRSARGAISHIKRSGPNNPNPEHLGLIRYSLFSPSSSSCSFILNVSLSSLLHHTPPHLATPRASVSSPPLSPIPVADLSAPRLQAHFLIPYNVCPC